MTPSEPPALSTDPKDLLQKLRRENGVKHVIQILEPRASNYPEILNDNFRDQDKIQVLSLCDAVQALAYGVLGDEPARKFLRECGLVSNQSRVSESLLAEVVKALRKTISIKDISLALYDQVSTPNSSFTGQGGPLKIISHKAQQLLRFLKTREERIKSECMTTPSDKCDGVTNRVRAWFPELCALVSLPFV